MTDIPLNPERAEDANEARRRRLVIRVQLPGPPRPAPPPPNAQPTRVTTASGAVYLLDPRSMTAVRVRRNGAELRRDGEPVRLLSWREPVLGVGMALHLQVRETDDIPTIRTTTPVVAIERLP